MEKTLRRTLLEVRDRILTNLPDLAANEERVRQLLIDPVLEALGWDFASGAVLTEYPLPTDSRGKNPVLDYVLMDKTPWGSIPRVAIEAKRVDGQVLPLKNKRFFFEEDVKTQVASILAVICQEGIWSIPRGGKHFPESIVFTDGDIWEIYKVLLGTSGSSTPQGYKKFPIDCENNSSNSSKEESAEQQYEQPDESILTTGAPGVGASGGKKQIYLKQLEVAQITRDSLVEVAQILESHLSPEAMGRWESATSTKRMTLRQAYTKRGQLPSSKGSGPSLNLCIRLADNRYLETKGIKLPDLPEELLKLTETNFGTKIAPFKSGTGFSVETKSTVPSLSTKVKAKPPHTSLRSILNTYTLALAIWKANPELAINPDTIEIEFL
ncbi:hypothetical protein [Meiothermus sp.]|jgi:hypothetical protein|uniref:hypothetical protein n=1 Tax=Meiothermus sp. TaxID=1955249 RepID=UPI0021DE4850|nr:hypothetical protein [Meiothermus sp.]GIW24510.1 MAG: hypothetical protein KatS3mg069_0777 [Meiothermus sp.]